MKNIYRIMHYENLDQLIVNGGQYSRNQMKDKKINYKDISNNNIQSRREDFNVPVAPYQKLYDYVPFYFTNRSPMLFACHTGHASDYSEGQESIIYLVSDTEMIKEKNIDYIYTDGQANSNGTGFYKGHNDFQEIDWDIIESWSWGNSKGEEDRKRKKQAELLVPDFFSIDLVKSIVVHNEAIQKIVEVILEKHGWKVPVLVQKSYYYN